MFFCPKKGLHQNLERFSVQNQVISKKKKVFMCTDTHFYSSSLSHDLLLLSPQLRLEGGGLFSFLKQKSASELKKNTRYFAYFSGQWGGYSTICPPPPLAMLLSSIVAT